MLVWGGGGGKRAYWADNNLSYLGGSRIFWRGGGFSKKNSKVLSTFFFRSTILIFRALRFGQIFCAFGSAGVRIPERRRPPPPPLNPPLLQSKLLFLFNVIILFIWKMHAATTTKRESEGWVPFITANQIAES